MSESIVATIEYDLDQDDVEKVIDLDPSISWNDFKMILSCFLSCENFRIYYQDDEGDQVIVSSEEEFQQAFKIAKRSRSISFKIMSADKEDPLSVFQSDSTEDSIKNERREVGELKILDERLRSLSITATSNVSVPSSVTEEGSVCIPIEDDQSTFKVSKEIQASAPDLIQKTNASKWVMTEISTEDSASQVSIETPSSSLTETPEWFHSSMEKYMIRLERMMKRDSQQRGKSVEVQTTDETDNANNYALVLAKQDQLDLRSKDEYSEEANVTCEHCQCFIIGHYFKCANCSDYNLCSNCEEFSDKIHLNNHVFLKIKIPLPFSSLKRDRFGNLKPILKRNLYELRARKMKKRKNAPIEFMEKKMQETQLENSSCLRRRRVPREPNFDQKVNGRFDAFFFGDCSHPDGTAVLPGTEFTKEWIVLNTGNQEWDNAVAITYLCGNLPATQLKFPVKPLKPKDSGLIQVDLQAPLEPGHYTCYWTLTRHGENFGKRVWCSIIVPSPTDHSSCLDEEEPLLNQSFEYVDSSPEHEMKGNQLQQAKEDNEDNSSIDSEFLIIPMPDCFDVTKPLTVDYEVERKTVDDILAVSAHIKSETLEPEIAPPPSLELDERSETPDEEETNNEEAIFVDAQEITTDDTTVEVEVEKCEIYLPNKSNSVKGEITGNENQSAFYQKAFGVLNKVAKGAASAAVGTTKNVFQTLQAQQTYIPPQSKWLPTKSSENRPETDEEWLRKRQDVKKNDMDNLVAMGFANRKLNLELLQKHNNNMTFVVDELIHRQESPVRN